MFCVAETVAMASKAVFAVRASGLVLLLSIGCLASDSLTPSEQKEAVFDSTRGAAGGRDVLQCPGVCPACPGCPACPSPPTCERPIPPGYRYYEGFGYYKMNYIGGDWFDAKDECERTGGYLVVLNSQDEANLVNKILEKHDYTNRIHVGFYDILKNQTYVTLLGDPLSSSGYFVWGPNEPNSPGTALCGAYNDKGLDDIDCSNVYGFLCEL